METTIMRINAEIRIDRIGYDPMTLDLHARDAWHGHMYSAAHSLTESLTEIETAVCALAAAFGGDAATLTISEADDADDRALVRVEWTLAGGLSLSPAECAALLVKQAARRHLHA